jgi:hypothetical protein
MAHPSILRPFVAVALCCTPLLGACGQKAAAPASQPAAPAAQVAASAEEPHPEHLAVKFETPEACFEAMTALKENDDPAAGLRCLSEANINYLAGNLAFQLQRFAALSDGGDASAACLKVLQSHGLAEVDIMGFLQVVDSPVPGGATPGFMQIGDSIKDKPTFFRESNNAMNLVAERLKAADDSGEDQDQPDEAAVSPKVKLTEVKVNGDKAEGVVIIGGVETSKSPVHFRRENGSWVVALAAEEPNWKQPIQGRFRFSDLLNQ